MKVVLQRREVLESAATQVARCVVDVCQHSISEGLRMQCLNTLKVIGLYNVDVQLFRCCAL